MREIDLDRLRREGNVMRKNTDTNPKSEKIAEYKGGTRYWVTAAVWNSGFTEDSYEIGIRDTCTGKFELVQGDFTHQSVQEVANAIAHLLSIETENYDASWCVEHFK